MMTWLTRISWLDTAEDLSDNLLLQQRKEAFELVHFLLVGERDEDLSNHPVVRMWTDYEAALAAYAAVVNLESVRRGYHNRGAGTLDTTVQQVRRTDSLSFVLPPWKEDTDVLRSHRSNLMRRFPDDYSWKGTPERMPYLWPFPDESGEYGLFVSKHDRELLAAGERSLPKEIKTRVENL